VGLRARPGEDPNDWSSISLSRFPAQKPGKSGKNTIMYCILHYFSYICPDFPNSRNPENIAKVL
jgi:hypothetical protein